MASHGVTRLSTYSKRVELGLVSGRVTPEILRDGGSILSVDGKNGMGACVGRWCMDLCIQRARERGSCFAAVVHGNHFGYAAYFTERAARAGMLGLAISNGPKALPPTGGRRPLLGTSAAARGKVTLAYKTGMSIPLGWGVDKDGIPTTDPNKVLSGGAMLPMGGPKGYAISLLIELLCSCLAGAENGQTMGSFYDLTRRQETGYCFAALDLSRIVDRDVWVSRVQSLLESMRACPRQPGVEEIKIPGQPEQEAMERNRERGLLLAPAVEDELRELAEHFGLSLPQPLAEK